MTDAQRFREAWHNALELANETGKPQYIIQYRDSEQGVMLYAVASWTNAPYAMVCPRAPYFQS
jgi:hypothetical protein